MKSKKMKAIMLIFPLTAILIVPTFNSTPTDVKASWLAEIIDKEGITGRYTSIDLDSSGFPHISYCREDDGGYVKYAYWNGDKWTINTIDEGFDDAVGNVLTTSIEIDSNDHPHIAYAKPPNMIKYSHFNGIDWEYETIYIGQGVYGSVGLALDSNDAPHISFCDGLGSYVLRYAYFDGLKWKSEIIDNNDKSGIHNSISIDTKDCVHIAYSDINQNEIKYAFKDKATSEWSLETVDTDILGFPYYPAIDVDSCNCPHIGYYDAGNDINKLKYACKSDSSYSWNVDTIISEKQVGYSYSLAISNEDNPYLMYQNIESKDLCLIYWNQTEWQDITIDSEGMVGCCSDIVLAANEIACISYRDEEFGNLKFAFKNIAPNAPDIFGPSKGKAGKQTSYTFVTSDTNNHKIEYYVDWGDDSNSGWIGPHQSGTEIFLNHTWKEEDNYQIRVMAKDTYGSESDWSSLDISMPKPKLFPRYCLDFLYSWLQDLMKYFGKTI